MDEPSNPRLELWRGRLRHLGALLRKAVPFAAGVAATFTALLLYRAAFPPEHTLTAREVNERSPR